MKFVQESRNMIISDPCYDKPPKGQLSFRAKRGTWIVKAHVGEDKHLSALEAHLEGYSAVSLRQRLGKVFTDSGLQSIYDKRYYRDDTEIPDLPGLNDEMQRLEMLHEKYKIRRTSRWDAGTHLVSHEGLETPHGVMLPTSWGDGVWSVKGARVFRNSGVVRVVVIFNEAAFDA